MSQLKNICGAGWQTVQPPLPVDESSVIARCNGQPIRAGFEVETLEDTENVMHKKFRTGCYDIELRLYSGARTASGELKVERADGY